MDEVAITVIGAGVVGLAAAAAFSEEYDGVVLLERHEGYGKETSSRNSEVIHSGIYYPKDSLKARLCVEGAAELYRFCEAHGVSFKRLGKLIVATEGPDIPRLEALLERGVENGVEGLEMWGPEEVAGVEPNVRAAAAIYSPGTGIFDSHSFMRQLLAQAESRGAMCAFHSEVDRIEPVADGYRIGLKGEDYAFSSRVVVNSGGLWADRVAALAGLDVDGAGYRLRYCKGSYFSYAKPSPVGRLIYPLPHEDLRGLGVHATLDLGGRLRFGPDAEYVDSPEDYRVEPSRRDAFYESASGFISGLDREAFIPDMAGIRPKLDIEGVGDFVIRHEFDRGLKGFVNIIGIESPGLTASLAIARHIKGMVREIMD